MKLRFPGFKILDRYILGKFLATYFFAIAMIIVVVVLFDYVEKIDDFTELHAPLNEVIFDYYLNFIPFFINQFSGLFTFIACIFFTSKMAYQTEIVAMLSGGMSFRRLMWPYFLGALIIGSLSLTLNLWLIPISQRHIVNFESQYIKRKQNAKFNRHIYRQIDSINIIEVEKHARFAYPLSTFILTLIGVSLSSRKVRGGTGLHIGIGTGLCFSYILFNRFFEEFAKSGTLPPGLAVWLPNIIYLFIAIYLYRKAPK